MARPCKVVMILVESVDGEAGTEFRLEPCGLRRHDVAGVGDVDELLHRDRVKREGDPITGKVVTMLED